VIFSMSDNHYSVSPKNSVSPKIWLIMPAAGSGSRMRQVLPKQYLNINQIPIIEHTINIFLANPVIEQLMICLPVDDLRFASMDVANNPRVATTSGGGSRAQSVLNGLNALTAADHDWVLVHDAARPCLSGQLLEQLIEQLRNDEVGGILAMPAKDTLKQSTSNQKIASTIDRSTIWQAQTPQMFRFGLLHSALSNAIKQGIEITDEASSLEAMGYQPKLVQGDARNIKITTPEDLELAEFLLQQTLERS